MNNNHQIVSYILNKINNNNKIIYVLCFNTETLYIAQEYYKKYNWAKPIIIENQDYTFENAFLPQLLKLKDEWINYDMVGMISWKAYQKIDINNINNLYNNNNNYVYFLNSKRKINDDAIFHPNLIELWNYLVKELDIKKFDFNLSYCNYFMCKPHIMIQYINWYLEKCLPVLLKNELSYTDAMYCDGQLKPDKLIKLWGKPYYPHIPFILERFNKAFFVNYID